MHPNLLLLSLISMNVLKLMICFRFFPFLRQRIYRMAYLLGRGLHFAIPRDTSTLSLGIRIVEQTALFLCASLFPVASAYVGASYNIFDCSITLAEDAVCFILALLCLPRVSLAYLQFQRPFLKTHFRLVIQILYISTSKID